jgi:hypothetical protein
MMIKLTTRTHDQSYTFFRSLIILSSHVIILSCVHYNSVFMTIARYKKEYQKVTVTAYEYYLYMILSFCINNTSLPLH